MTDFFDNYDSVNTQIRVKKNKETGEVLDDVYYSDKKIWFINNKFLFINLMENFIKKGILFNIWIHHCNRSFFN